MGGPTRFVYTHRVIPTVSSVILLYLLLLWWLLQASLNFDDPTLKALLKALPEAPAMAQRKCLQRCGLYDGDDKKNDSASDDY